MEINKIIQGDCLEIMKLLPDKCIDLVLTDPPYGLGNNITYRKNNHSKRARSKDYGKYTWNDQIPSKEYFEEMIRVSKNQIIWGGNYFTEYLKNSSCWLVWDKDNATSTFADCELAWTSFDTAVRNFKWRWNGMIQQDMKHKELRQHPTQKPVALMEWIIQNYSQKDHLILDCFAGAGSTLIAARNLQRNFIGIEISPEYCKIAENRLKQQVLNF